MNGYIYEFNFYAQMFLQRCNFQKYKPCLHTMRFVTFHRFVHSEQFLSTGWNQNNGSSLCYITLVQPIVPPCNFIYVMDFKNLFPLQFLSIQFQRISEAIFAKACTCPYCRADHIQTLKVRTLPWHVFAIEIL